MSGLYKLFGKRLFTEVYKFMTIYAEEYDKILGAALSLFPAKNQYIEMLADSSINGPTYGDAVRLVNTTTSGEIIVDNSDGSNYYEEFGPHWYWSGAPNTYANSARALNRALTGSDTRYCRFYLPVLLAGDYYVYEWHPTYAYANHYVKATVRYYDTTTSGFVTDTQTISHGANSGRWNLLGTYYFDI